MKRGRQFLGIMIPSVIVLLGVVAGFLESVVSTQIPQAVTPYLRFAWLVFFVVILALLGFTLWWNRISRKPDNPTLTPNSHGHLSSPLLAKTQSRQALRKRVYNYWIADQLASSLDGILPLSLDLRERPDAFENPFGSDSAKPKQPGHSLPPDIREIYEKNALAPIG